MIPPLFRCSDPTIAALYGAIVTQAREPGFYESYGVPDTVLGRFDLIVLHLALVLRRLSAGDGLHAVAQSLFDAFCRDMDHNLREMGISDQGLPRQMRRVGEAFYGRAQAYDAALAAPGSDMLAETLRRNVYAEAVGNVAAGALAAYVRKVADELDAQAPENIARGVVSFPHSDPAVLTGAE